MIHLILDYSSERKLNHNYLSLDAIQAKYKMWNKMGKTLTFLQRLNETLNLVSACKNVKKPQRLREPSRGIAEVCWSVFSHSHSFSALPLLSVLLVVWQRGCGVLKRDLGLVNTRIINLNRNEPGRLWWCLRLRRRSPAVNPRDFVLHESHCKSLTTYRTSCSHCAACCLLYTGI